MMEIPTSLVGKSTFAQALHDGDMIEIPSCVDGTLPDSQAQFGSVTKIMLACTNSPAQTHAQWQFSEDLDINLDQLAFRDGVFDILTRSLQTADHKTC